MGKIISVWSLLHQTGKTVFLYNLLSYISEMLQDNKRILVCCANRSYGNLMSLFNIEKSELNLEDMVNFKVTSGGDINIFDAVAKHNNIYFCGSRNTDSTYAARNIKAYEELLSDFKGRFDLILIDTMAGRDDTLTNMILGKSDGIINVLLQDKERFDNNSFKNDKDLIYIISKYKYIYPDLRDIISDYRLNIPVYTLPQCDRLQDMNNKKKLSLYVQHETEYNRRLQDITLFILRKLKLGIKENKQDNAKKSGRIKNVLLSIMGESL